MPFFTVDEIEEAAGLVYRHMKPTPQYAWPLLSERAGATVWVKHENHTPTGAFKVRGGITFIDWLKRTHPTSPGIVTATRGNHGQSQARAATAAGLIEFGSDFDEAKVEAMRLAAVEGLFPVPPFHRELARGVATYALELFSEARDLDTVYVPIGCGSGICGVIAVRDALGLATEVVGVVSTEAQGAKLSFEAGKLIETNSANTIADGMAVRVPVQEAFDIYSKGASRIVAVSDDEIAEAMRILYRDTHNLAEGAGAAALAALLKEKDTIRGKKVGIILSGGNVDLPLFARILTGDLNKPAQ